jgi:hypothetical protein
MCLCRSAGYKELLGHDITFKMATLLASIFFRPSHPDPALGSYFTAERSVKSVTHMWPIVTCLYFVSEKVAHFYAQCFGFSRQADWIESYFASH